MSNSREMSRLKRHLASSDMVLCKYFCSLSLECDPQYRVYQQSMSHLIPVLGEKFCNILYEGLMHLKRCFPGAPAGVCCKCTYLSSRARFLVSCFVCFLWSCHRCEQAKSSGTSSLDNLEKITGREKQKDNIIVDIGVEIQKTFDLISALCSIQRGEQTYRMQDKLANVYN